MSHELRTPLNAIIGFTRIVHRKSQSLLPEKQIENLEKVLVSAEHLLALINTTLDIAKIEAGRMDVLASNFRIEPLIDLCINTTAPMIKPRVKLEKQVDPNLDLVYSDQDKIRQIVLNLLSNAAKFTPRGIFWYRLDTKRKISCVLTCRIRALESTPKPCREYSKSSNRQITAPPGNMAGPDWA
jgi:signal transduction histidine kinase